MILSYERDGIRVYLGDSREPMDLLERESVDLIVTDPPYGIGYRSNYRASALDVIQGDDDSSWVPAALTMAGMKLRRDRHAYVFGSFPLEEFPLRVKAELVWDKMLHGSGDLSCQWGSSHERIMFCNRAADRAMVNMDKGKVPARLRSGSIIRCRRPNANGVRRHPTEKPVALLRRMIESSSFPGEIVFDPFVGSGSTAVAAVAEGRRAIVVDVDPKNVAETIRRVDRALNAVHILDEACR